MSQARVSDKENSNMIKDPEDWVTGDEEMTGHSVRTFKLYAKKPAKSSTRILQRLRPRSGSTNYSSKPDAESIIEAY